jgi:hypothetical protein
MSREKKPHDWSGSAGGSKIRPSRGLRHPHRPALSFINHNLTSGKFIKSRAARWLIYIVHIRISRLFVSWK